MGLLVCALCVAYLAYTLPSVHPSMFLEVQYMYICRWEELNSLAEQRRRLLRGAEQVHKFVRDATETNDRMNEKASFIATVLTLARTTCMYVLIIHTSTCICCLPVLSHYSLIQLLHS